MTGDACIVSYCAPWSVWQEFIASFCSHTCSLTALQGCICSTNSWLVVYVCCHNVCLPEQTKDLSHGWLGRAYSSLQVLVHHGHDEYHSHVSRSGTYYRVDILSLKWRTELSIVYMYWFTIEKAKLVWLSTWQIGRVAYNCGRIPWVDGWMESFCNVQRGGCQIDYHTTTWFSFYITYLNKMG